MPTRWHIRSLGSESTYELSHDKKRFHIKGSGLAHQEKNWGQAFPSGHVWLQAISPDNKFQVCKYWSLKLSYKLFGSSSFKGGNQNKNSLDLSIFTRTSFTFQRITKLVFLETEGYFGRYLTSYRYSGVFSFICLILVMCI